MDDLRLKLPNWRPPFAEWFCSTIAWEKVISDYQSGMSPKQLGVKYGCTSNTIRKRLKEAGVKKISARKRNRMNFPMEQVISDYQSDMTLAQLAKKYGSSITTIRKRLIDVGAYKIDAVERRGRHKINLPMAQVISDYESGISTRQLGEKYGVGETTIRTRLIEAGVQIRKRGFGGMSRSKKETIYGRLSKNYKVKNISVAHIISEYQSGMSADELGDKYGNNAFIMQLID
mgnify:CR=1 FL=1